MSNRTRIVVAVAAWIVAAVMVTLAAQYVPEGDWRFYFSLLGG